MYEKVKSTNPGMANSLDFQKAIILMNNKIPNSVMGFPNNKNVIQEIFYYGGNTYRLDLDSYNRNGRSLSK